MRDINYFNAVHWFAVILYFRFAVHRSSGFIFVRRPSSTVFSRLLLSTVVFSPSFVIYRPFQPSFDRSTSPLDYDIARGSHANSIEQVPLQSCRKLCYEHAVVCWSEEDKRRLETDVDEHGRTMSGRTEEEDDGEPMYSVEIINVSHE